jgi:hypothetical protein
MPVLHRPQSSSRSRRTASAPIASIVALIAVLAACGAAEARAASTAAAHRGGGAHHVTLVGARHKTAHARTSVRHGRGGHTQQSPPADEPAPAPASEPALAPAPAPEPTPAPAEEPAPAPEPTPEPAPAPEPTPVPSSDLLFSATHLRDFWLNQSAPGAITEVPDPAGSGQSVFEFTVGDNDMTNITPNPRGELLSPSAIHAGEEFWFATKFFLPTDFPASIPGWMNVMQGPYGSPFNGPPPWHIELNGSHIQWMRNGTYHWDVPWQMPLVRGSWVSVMVHERFGSDGWIEMWVNGQQIDFFGSGTYNPNKVAPTTRLAMQTMDASNNGAPNSIYLQSYRKVGMFPSLTSYDGPLRIGRTRVSVGG